MARSHHRKTAATANPVLAAAMREIARSNAAGTHANKATRRRRTRAGA